MNLKAKVIIVTLIVAALAFLSGRAIWPDYHGAPVPSSTQMPFLIVLSLADSILFGLGVAFLIFGYSYFVKKGYFWTYLSIAWLFMSWWPHVNLHRSVGVDLWGIIAIDYGFHVTVMIASLIVTKQIIKLLKKN